MQKLNFIYWSYFHPAIRLQKQHDLQAARVCHLVETPTNTTHYENPRLTFSPRFEKEKVKVAWKAGSCSPPIWLQALFFFFFSGTARNS